MRDDPGRASFARRLLSYYDEHRRDLPWRHTDSPWAIWVSEIMLQQTRVEAVRAAYSSFVARYPNPETFAGIDDDELLAAWRGLGYYRRARLLREGARTVLERHGGEVPSSPAELAALPGIGGYTCGAVASIAFGHRVPAIDGNVERVFARHRAIRTPIKTGAGRREVRAAVLVDLPETRAGDFNQAVMELGATVCTPRNPQCDSCPIATDCAGRAADLIEELPILPKRREMIDVQARGVLVAGADGRVLGYRIAPGEINGGQVDLPGPGPLVSCSGAEELAAILFERFGVRFTIGDELRAVRHGITHHRITLVTHRANRQGKGNEWPSPLTMARTDDPGIPWTTTARKVFAKIGLPAVEAGAMEAGAVEEGE